MAGRVRVGVVGTSWWTEAMHLPSLSSHPMAELAAICGRDEGRAESLAASFAIPEVFGDYRAMLAQGRLDALVIATPDDLHYEMTMAGLGRGLHILCEKPLAHTLQQARAMAALAERAGVKHMVGFSWRGLPHYRYLRELVRGGYLGRCYAADFSYLTGGGARGGYSWRYDARRSSGALGNYGAHMIDMAQWLLGDIVRVGARLAVCVARPGLAGPSAANDLAALAVDFAGGATGVIHVSEVAEVGERLHEQRIRLYGAAGTLESELTLAGSDLRRGEVRIKTELRGARAGERGFALLPVPAALYAGASPTALFEPFMRHSVGDRHFIDAILADRPPEPSFHDGAAVQAVIEAALRSQRRGGWVAVEARRGADDGRQRRWAAEAICF
jgi:predicted dehydrogenase